MQKKCSFCRHFVTINARLVGTTRDKHNSRQIESPDYVFNSILVLHLIKKLDRVRTATLGESKSVKLIFPEKRPALTAYNPTNGARVGKQVRRGTNRSCG